jgi:integron integrase
VPFPGPILRGILLRMRSTAVRAIRPPPAPPSGAGPQVVSLPLAETAWRPGEAIERLRRRIRARHLSPRTEETYLRWVRRYIDFHGGRNPAALGRVEIERFVAHLSDREGLGPPSVNQAASAVAFLYRELYGQEMGRRDALRAKQQKRLPKYATPDEVARVLLHLEGIPLVAALLMYGSGTRVAETMGIRLKDLSLETGELHVRGGKGAKDRTTVVAQAALPALRAQVASVLETHAQDRAEGGGWAPLPGALHRKDPRAGWDIGWQYLFPSAKTSVDPKTGRRGRRTYHASNVQRAVKRAAREARVPRPVTCHVLRHCFATELLKSGCDLKLLQRLMGHRYLRTTSRYLHILDRPGVGVVSPLDRLPGYRLPTGPGRRATDVLAEP